MDDIWNTLKKFWHWLWHDDSVLSWVVSIGLAFIVIKFILYPVLGLLMGTQFPVVAVVSDSMEHNKPFDEWWMEHEDKYLKHNITQSDFKTYPMQRGFNKGDIIILLGVKADKIKQGDIIVYWGGKAYPIIHRTVGVQYDENGRFFQTKGDNNLGQIINPPYLDETHIPYDVPCEEEKEGSCPIIVGRAAVRIPWLGWVKIGAVELLAAIGILPPA